MCITTASSGVMIFIVVKMMYKARKLDVVVEEISTINSPPKHVNEELSDWMIGIAVTVTRKPYNHSQ